MNICLLDTNIFLYYLEDQKEIVSFFSDQKKNQDIISYSFITKIELLEVPGLIAEETILIENMLSEFYRIDYCQEIEDILIIIRKHKKIKIPDAIIAASAIFNDSILVTRNTQDFINIPNLKVLNPFA